MTAPTTSTSTPTQVAVNDIGSADDFLAAIDATIKYFNDGDIVEGTIVKVDRDEVLLDIGYKTEGVIPSRELSIKHDVDPNEVVGVGDDLLQQLRGAGGVTRRAESGDPLIEGVWLCGGPRPHHRRRVSDQGLRLRGLRGSTRHAGRDLLVSAGLGGGSPG